ncbi:mycothiol transferase [Nocardia farcinica]|uniref:mycothiol transferase n=1 Tax=Nocardia farcinica TaxID=37329 RepID=UPI002453B1ED|nr:DUF664 domain-containing protein [Nocardia farcinica]
MRSSEVLADAFTRIGEVVHEAVDGLDERALSFRVDGRANTIAWLVWHLTRVQDDHVSEVAGRDQVWIEQGWHERFALPFDPRETGYGQSPEEVGQVGVSAELLAGYYDAVQERSLAFVRGLADEELDRVVDTSWDPPVTLGVRLVSVLGDDLQHAGQAAYLRGVVERAG